MAHNSIFGLSPKIGTQIKNTRKIRFLYIIAFALLFHVCIEKVKASSSNSKDPDKYSKIQEKQEKKLETEAEAKAETKVDRRVEENFLEFPFFLILGPNRYENQIDINEKKGFSILRKIDDLIKMKYTDSSSKPIDSLEGLRTRMPDIIADLQLEMNASCVFLFKKEIEKEGNDIKKGAENFIEELKKAGVTLEMLRKVGLLKKFVMSVEKKRRVTRELEDEINKSIDSKRYLPIQVRLNTWRDGLRLAISWNKEWEEIIVWSRDIVDMLRAEENSALYPLRQRAERTATYDRIEKIQKMLDRLNTLLNNRHSSNTNT